MQPDAWFKQAQRDAIHKNLPKLVPLLDMLRDATQSLRGNNWLTLPDNKKIPIGQIETPLTVSSEAPSIEQK